MKRLILLTMAGLIVVVCVINLLNLYDNRFPYGRMWETPAVRPHEAILPAMEKGSIPVSGEDAFLRQMEGARIHSPVAGNSQSVIASGHVLYRAYCTPCHGKALDGNGTVGQSFQPLPTDLKSSRVQGMSDGALFKTISYGNPPNGRQPPLAATIAVEDRWKIIAFIKSPEKTESAAP